MKTVSLVLKHVHPKFYSDNNGCKKYRNIIYIDIDGMTFLAFRIIITS